MNWTKKQNYFQNLNIMSPFYSTKWKFKKILCGKHTGELIGFVDLGDMKLNYATFKNVSVLATHILVFLVKCCHSFIITFATFVTTGITSYQIFLLFWKVVNILENINLLKVIAATADGASPNRKFFRMHKFLGGDAEKAVIYRSENLFSKEKRYIHFLQMHRL